MLPITQMLCLMPNQQPNQTAANQSFDHQKMIKTLQFIKCKNRPQCSIKARDLFSIHSSFENKDYLECNSRLFCWVGRYAGHCFVQNSSSILSILQQQNQNKGRYFEVPCRQNSEPNKWSCDCCESTQHTTQFGECSSSLQIAPSTNPNFFVAPRAVFIARVQES